MWRKARWYLAGCVVLVTLAGCGRSWIGEQRAAWRHEAEVQCLKSGTVHLGVSIVQIAPIEGPGACGMDFPLKVAAIDGSTALSFADDMRPPGAIPNGGASPAQPRWPIAEPRAATQSYPAQTSPAQPYPSRPVQSQSLPAAVSAPRAEPLRPPAAQLPPDTYSAQRATDWRPLDKLTAAPAAAAPANAADDDDDDSEPASNAGAPISLDPSGNPNANAQMPYDFRKPYGSMERAQGAERRIDPAPRMAAPAPVVPLRSDPGPRYTSAMPAVAVNPPATLACPMVSALDQWLAMTVQPAAMRWFSQPVVEIKQISAYSCRGMNGQPGAHISEHAFGNALDVAAFTFADGHKLTVQQGWHGSAEEQGFLHDVQLGACEEFKTTLAPGYNVYHYNHIHVDLMRRNSGHIACQPKAVPGEVAASRVRGHYAGRDPGVTGSIGSSLSLLQRRALSFMSEDAANDKNLPLAIPGEDGTDDE